MSSLDQLMRSVLAKYEVVDGADREKLIISVFERRYTPLIEKIDRELDQDGDDIRSRLSAFLFSCKHDIYSAGTYVTFDYDKRYLLRVLFVYYVKPSCQTCNCMHASHMPTEFLSMILTVFASYTEPKLALPTYGAAIIEQIFEKTYRTLDATVSSLDQEVNGLFYTDSVYISKLLTHHSPKTSIYNLIHYSDLAPPTVWLWCAYRLRNIRIASEVFYAVGVFLDIWAPDKSDVHPLYVKLEECFTRMWSS